MADMQGRYWDLDDCAWVRYPTLVETADVPQQPTGLEADREADVRSG